MTSVVMGHVCGHVCGHGHYSRRKLKSVLVLKKTIFRFSSIVSILWVHQNPWLGNRAACIAIACIVMLECDVACDWNGQHIGQLYSSSTMLKVIYHPLYGMNNYIFIWGDWLSCDHLRGSHDSQSPHIWGWLAIMWSSITQYKETLVPHLVATLIYLSQMYSYYIRGERSPLT